MATFQTNLGTDAQTLAGAVASIQNSMNQVEAQLLGQYGQLHSLQNATCPNNNDITQCEQDIASIQGEFTSYKAALVTFSNAESNIQEAGTATAYLQSFWNAISADIGNCVNGLSNIASDPPFILQLDLETNQSNWNNLQSNFQQMSQQAVQKKLFQSISN